MIHNSKTNNITTSSASKVDRGDLMPKVLAWIICPIVILFSYMPVLNITARAVFIAFIAWCFMNIAFRGKKLYPTPPLLVFLLWTFYALLPSIFALNLNIALTKWITIFLLGLVSFSVAQSVAWGGVKPWAWAYCISSILSIVSNYLPIESYLSIDYETEQFGRTVGTFGNANTYGRVMVEASFISIFLVLIEKSKPLRLILYACTIIFGLAVLQSSSRTALIGFLIVLLGAFQSTGWVVVKLRNLPVTILALCSAAAFAVYQPEIFLPMLERMNILLSYFGLAEKIETRDRSMSHRQELINKAWDTWLDYPLGVGLDNYKLISGVYAHSNYFELLASVGLIGLLIYYTSYFRLYWWLKSNKRSIESASIYKFLILAIIVSLAMDISNVSYYSKPLWLFIAILTGFIASQRPTNKL